MRLRTSRYFIPAFANEDQMDSDDIGFLTGKHDQRLVFAAPSASGKAFHTAPLFVL
jgi:hypothetical protein